jgi:hypothetical protein
MRLQDVDRSLAFQLQLEDDSIDPGIELLDPAISDSERIRRANRRFEQWYRQEVRLTLSRQ